ncbi:AAA family ATPase [Streptomyces sp. NPDC012751]|uniref:AAA family ATPase n=1 Tax=Streptomyces sp. NPDC012751 TaxID=3364846 RepID=UPI0036927229
MTSPVGKPSLIVVSGGPGTGKTTLAHELARVLGCPAIIRDEIKQGMVMSHPGYRGGGGDPLNAPTLHAFFGVLKVLLEAGVTLVAEAAYQDRLWRPNLAPLTGLAHLRVIRCAAGADVAHDRIVRRAEEDAHRAAHGDRDLLRAIAAGEHSLESFVPISLDAPTLTVDTSNGYRPGLRHIADFARASAHGGSSSERSPQTAPDAGESRHSTGETP